MTQWTQILFTIFGSVIASSGFWAYIMQHSDRKSVQTEMLIGLGHDRIIGLGMAYIARGDWITQDEYENLNAYLYTPYKKMGGNGSAERIMTEVNKLRLVKDAPIK